MLQLQQDAARGRQVLQLLTHDPGRVVPHGTLYLSPRFFVGVFVVLGTLKVVGANYMLGALTLGPYAQLFVLTSCPSTAI